MSGGKIFGFILGAALGGPLGAGLGTFLGALVDDENSKSGGGGFEKYSKSNSNASHNSQQKSNQPAYKNGFWVQAFEGKIAIQCSQCTAASFISEPGKYWVCPECNDGILHEVTQEDLNIASSGTHRNLYVGLCSAFYLLGHISKADGVISPEEIKSAENIMRRLGVEGDEKKDLQNAFKNGKNGSSYNAVAKTFLNVFIGDNESIYTFLCDILEICHSDGDFSENERKIVRDIALNIFGVKEDFFIDLENSIGGKSTSSITEVTKAYAVLGCTHEDCQKTIKKKYNELSKKYHPDTIAGKDLPEEFVTFATEKFQEVNQAYEIIIAHLKTQREAA